MGSGVVVVPEPAVGDLADLAEILEQIGVENFLSVCAVEPFDVGVLVGFAGLDVPNFDSALLAPVHEDLRDDLRAVVATNRLR